MELALIAVTYRSTYRGHMVTPTITLPPNHHTHLLYLAGSASSFDSGGKGNNPIPLADFNESVCLLPIAFFVLATVQYAYY